MPRVTSREFADYAKRYTKGIPPEQAKRFKSTFALLSLWEMPWSNKRLQWAFWTLRLAEAKGIPPVIER